MLGGNAGAVAPAGIGLSGLLPSGGLLPSALPGAAQAAPHTGQNTGVRCMRAWEWRFGALVI